MPRKARELSAIAVARLKSVRTPSGGLRSRYMVGGASGLHLRVDGDARSWILRVSVNGKRRDIGLGSYPDVSLATARKLANAHHDMIASGGDPLAERRARKAAATQAKTFRECVQAYLDAHAGEWRNAKHAAQWNSTLKSYAFPIFGDEAVSRIDTAMVLKAVEPLWRTKTETASRLRGRIERVLGWAAFQGFRSGDNPARWRDHLAHHLPARGDLRQVQHHASLPYAELPCFIAELRKREAPAARALEFAILCASRSGEVREAKWSEIDVDRCIWTIPAARMKAKREHVVPLSSAALAIIQGQRDKASFRSDSTTEYVFPAPRGGTMSDAVFRALFDRMGRGDITQHGFRSTFREWAGEVSNHPREVVEHALAHRLADKAEAAYQRGSLLPKRVALMEDWSAYCGKLKSRSVP